MEWIEKRGERAYVVESGYLVRRPAGVEAPATVLLLHGHGDTPDGFAARLAALAPAGAALVFAGAPLPFEQLDETSGERRIVRAWYCYDGDQERFRDALDELESYLDALLADARERAEIDTGRLIVIGYSQGAYVAGYYALRHAPRPLGLALVGGRLKHEFLEDRRDGIRGLPVLMLAGEKDERLPAARWAEGSRWLREAGAEVREIRYEGGHGLNWDATARLSFWLRDLLGAPLPG